MRNADDAHGRARIQEVQPEKLLAAMGRGEIPIIAGFQGIEGLFMCQLLGRVRRKMLSQGLPAVLADMGEDGRLRPGSTLRVRP